MTAARHIISAPTHPETLCGLLTLHLGPRDFTLAADFTEDSADGRPACLTCLRGWRARLGANRVDAPADAPAVTVGSSDIRFRDLPPGEPAQCDQDGCRRNHIAEVEFATNHLAQHPYPEAVLGLHGLGFVSVRDDERVTVWDPEHVVAVTLPRAFAGVAHIADDTVRLLQDNAPGQGPGTVWHPDLTPVERAVLVTRLRAWATAVEVTP